MVNGCVSLRNNRHFGRRTKSGLAAIGQEGGELKLFRQTTTQFGLFIAQTGATILLEQSQNKLSPPFSVP